MRTDVSAGTDEADAQHAKGLAATIAYGGLCSVETVKGNRTPRHRGAIAKASNTLNAPTAKALRSHWGVHE